LGLDLNYGVLDLTLRQLSYRKTALLITIVQGSTASSLDTLATSPHAIELQGARSANPLQPAALFRPVANTVLA